MMAVKLNEPQKSCSAQYLAFRTCFDQVVRGVQPCLASVARRLFAKSLISKEALSDAGNAAIEIDCRSHKLMLLILNKIEENLENFYTFLEILKLEPVLKHLAETLKSKLKYLRTKAHSAMMKNSRTQKCKKKDTVESNQPIPRQASSNKHTAVSQSCSTCKFISLYK